jgi:predicted nuclease of restriction endonuclease-like RecB superfamily
VFSAPLLRYEVSSWQIEPAYIDERYAELIRTLVEYYQAFTGKQYRELESALAESPQTPAHDRRLLAGLRLVIEESMALEVAAPAAPRRIREAVFESGARCLLEGGLMDGGAFRRAAQVLEAQCLQVQGEILPEHLYADLKPERVVKFPRAIPPVAEIISRYNFRLLQGFFLQAAGVLVKTDGPARPIYRFAKLKGLLLEVKKRREPGEAAGDLLAIEISGPLSLFRHTRRYGRALAAFLPACAMASRFQLEATIVLRGKHFRLSVTQADRVLSTHAPPRRFDSFIESRLHRDFIKLRSRWDVLREGDIIPLDSTVFIPDFTFRLRADPSLQVNLEIMGFWTADYLARKSLVLSQLPGNRFILCVDEKLCCDRERLPFPCIVFSGRVPAEKVLAALDAFVSRQEATA